MEDKRLPNLYIIGAAKAGTTTLYDTLKKYHQVYFPVQKEPSFFCDEEYYAKGVDWYLKTFYNNSAPHKIRGDATPRYLYWGERVVPRICSLYGDNLPKIIIIFRDPAKLVYSYYWQNVREGRETYSFRDALAAENDRMTEQETHLSYRGKFTYAYSRIALYATQLQPYLERFPREKILFLLTDDLKDFQKVTDKLEGFLDLDHKEWKKPVQSNNARLPRSQTVHQWFIKRSKFKDFFKQFIGYSLRHQIKQAAIKLNLKLVNTPPPDPTLMENLKNHYLPEVKRLEKIIDRDLSSWYEP